jgi:hypothetical protein
MFKTNLTKVITALVVFSIISISTLSVLTIINTQIQTSPSNISSDVSSDVFSDISTSDSSIFNQEIEFDSQNNNLETVHTNLINSWNKTNEKDISVAVETQYKINTLTLPFRLQIEQNSTLENVVTNYNTSKDQLIESFKQTISQKQDLLNQQTPVDAYGINGEVRFSAKDQMQEIIDRLNLINQLEVLNFDAYEKEQIPANQIKIDKIIIIGLKNSTTFTTLSKLYKKNIEEKVNQVSAAKKIRIEAKNNSAKIKTVKINPEKIAEAKINIEKVIPIKDVIFESVSTVANEPSSQLQIVSPGEIESQNLQTVKFTSYKNTNPDQTNKKSQEQINKELDEERDKALEHNKKVEQTYNESEKESLRQAGFDESTNFTTKKN